MLLMELRWLLVVGLLLLLMWLVLTTVCSTEAHTTQLFFNVLTAVVIPANQKKTLVASEAS